MFPRPLQVLLADPQDHTRRAMSRALAAAGFDVKEVLTAAEVIEQCDFDPPDVLILELNLPDMDGFDLLGCIRDDTRGADTTIIVTTEAVDEMTRAYLGPMVDFAGGDYFLAKPCDGKLLAQLLDDLAEEPVPAPRRTFERFPTRRTWPTTRVPASIGAG